MKRSKKEGEYKSYSAYQKKFFPIATEKHFIQIDNPHDFGVNLAKESLNKFKHLLVTKS